MDPIEKKKLIQKVEDEMQVPRNTAKAFVEYLEQNYSMNPIGKVKEEIKEASNIPYVSSNETIEEELGQED